MNRLYDVIAVSLKFRELHSLLLRYKGVMLCRRRDKEGVDGIAKNTIPTDEVLPKV